MNSYFLTFFFFRRHCLTFEASSPSGLLHQIEENKDFLLEMMNNVRETDIGFYRNPETRYYWLIENASTLDDAIFNLATNGHKIKPQGVKRFWAH